MPPLEQLTTAIADRYAIEREIGRGGMATVYLARDLRHSRAVALKVLDPELGAVLGADRFLAEIRVTANLQHPNLLPLFDSGEAGGLLFYVMPFVQGETLRARLDREKQLPVDEAVRLTVAVCGALDYAHRHGVIHRDLKPENILLHEGQPLVADFGIALAVSNAGGQRVTQTGLSLGTPQYMSPEQATGDRSIDGRTDIYSLGAIAYEMLTGEPPHLGTSAQAIIAKLMTEDPRPITTLRRSVPPQVDAAVRCALEKLPADRFASAKEFADALVDRSVVVHRGYVTGAPASTRRAWLMRALPWGVAVLAVAGAAAATIRRSPSASARPTRFFLDFPRGRRFEDALAHPVAISPDGRTIAYVGRGSQARMLFVRRLDELEARPVPGTELAADVEFSRDGASLSFLSSGKLRRIPLSGGPSSIVALPQRWAGTAWGPAGEIVFSADGAIWRVPSEGSAPVKLAEPDTARGEKFLSDPLVMPDGHTVLYTINVGASGFAGTRLGAVSSTGSGAHALPIAGLNPLAFVDGVLLYGDAAGSILGVRFNPASLKAEGEPVKLIEDVQIRNNRGGLSAAISTDGTIIYVRGFAPAHLALLDRTGKSLAELPEQQTFAAPTWSPDGKRIAVSLGRAYESASLWVYDLASKVLSRVTTRQDAFRPSWTADGRRIGFITTNSTAMWIPADGSAPEELLYGGEGHPVREVTFTPDGRFALFRTDAVPGATTRRDILIMPMAGPRHATALIDGPADDLHPAVSQDSRLMAYQSDETGRLEVYVHPLDHAGGRTQVSTGGGTEARWAPDGHLVYRGPTAFWSATLDVRGSDIRVARQDSLFPDVFEKADASRQAYDVSRDGRFVLVRGSSESAEVVVVTNWLTEVREKLRAH